MSFSPRKKAKLRKVRHDRNKRSWRGGCWRSVQSGKYLIDKISIQQILYLLTETASGYEIFRVGANGELTQLTPKKILGNKCNFEKTSKWANKTEVKINGKGEIVSVKRVKGKEIAFTGSIIVPIY